MMKNYLKNTSETQQQTKTVLLYWFREKAKDYETKANNRFTKYVSELQWAIV